MSRRLLLSYLSLTIVVLAVLEVPLGIVNARSERRDLEGRVERDAVAVASLAEGAVTQRSADGLQPLRDLAARYQADTGGRIVIVDRNGTALVDPDPLVPGTRNFSSRPEIAAALRGEYASGVRHSESLGVELLYVAAPIAAAGVVGGAVRVSYPMTEVDRRILRYWLALAGIAAVVLAIASAVALRFARTISRPLAQVQEAASAAGGGDLTARAPVVEGPPEVRELGLEFNDMIAKVESLLHSQQDFVADASHQLRTPLTALQLRLENLERDVAPEGQADLDGALAEVERLTALVEALLELARADAGVAPSGRVDLGAEVEERVSAWRALAEERSVELVARHAALPSARASPVRLRQVLDNLIDNAVEASPPGGTVEVETAANGDWLEVCVRDEGPGMTAEERARAFDRFWRSRRNGPGTGLGLAIARRLVEADGGEIELGDARDGGLEIRVRLRRA